MDEEILDTRDVISAEQFIKIINSDSKNALIEDYIVKGDVIISHISIVEVSLVNIRFEDVVKINKCSFTTLTFEQCVTCKSISFEGLKVEKSIFLHDNIFDSFFISSSVIKDRLEIVKSEVAMPLNFDKTNIIGRLQLTESRFQSDLIVRSQNIDLNFHASYFASSVYLLSSDVAGVNISNSYFQSNLNFKRGVSLPNLFFEHCTILGNLKLISVTFDSSVSFFDSDFNGLISFYECTFIKGVNFTGVNSTGGFGINNSVFYESVFFRKAQIENLDLIGTTTTKEFHFFDSHIIDASRETYRQIKHSFLGQNNRLEALMYYKREMLAFLTEQKRSKGRFYNYPLGDLIILKLNQISNNFGTSWTRGLLFILVSTTITYSLYFFSLNLKCSDYFVYYFEFINPVHRFQYIETENYNGISNLIDFLGRIVNGYGVYQLIQAFRKYGKM